MLVKFFLNLILARCFNLIKIKAIDPTVAKPLAKNFRSL